MCSPDLLDAMGAYATPKRGEEAREKRGLLLREREKKGEGEKREGEWREGKDGGPLQWPTRSSVLSTSLVLITFESASIYIYQTKRP